MIYTGNALQPTKYYYGKLIGWTPLII